jgi:16S rRNA (cytosine1402-N4)-methyltransferase
VSSAYAHQPVLVQEVLEAFAGDSFRVVVDGTLGLGGHTEQLLKQSFDRRVIGLDWDINALTIARERLEGFGSRFEGVQSSYADLPAVLAQKQIPTVDGLLLDLGLSSLQLSDPARGFSFNSNGPLDMRMSDSLPYTAWDFIVQNDERALEQIFKEYGEERFGRRAAIALKEALRSGELKNESEAVANVLRKAIPTRFGSIDAATRSFQALRIVVNGELDNVRKMLAALPDVLATGGRAVIIAFHSLEDRLVKRAFQQAVRGCVCPPRLPQCVCGKTPWGKMVTRKAIRATEAEIAENPRARSAVLRILEKL